MIDRAASLQPARAPKQQIPLAPCKGRGRFPAHEEERLCLPTGSVGSILGKATSTTDFWNTVKQTNKQTRPQTFLQERANTAGGLLQRGFEVSELGRQQAAHVGVCGIEPRHHRHRAAAFKGQRHMRQACELVAQIEAQFERRCTCRHAGARRTCSRRTTRS